MHLVEVWLQSQLPNVLLLNTLAFILPHLLNFFLEMQEVRLEPCISWLNTLIFIISVCSYKDYCANYVFNPLYMLCSFLKSRKISCLLHTVQMTKNILNFFQCPPNLHKQDGYACDSNQVCSVSKSVHILQIEINQTHILVLF